MDLDKWSPRRSNKIKKGSIYFRHKETGKKVWSSDLYAPKVVDSYTIINTLDGQVKIPEDALLGLHEWSNKFRMVTIDDMSEEIKIPTFNVSSSYLMRLIAISRASIQYVSLEGELKEKKSDQIVSMCNDHNRKPTTSFYDEEMEMTDRFFEFMESTRTKEIKLKVKSNQWTISPELFSSSIGFTVDPMDPNFTDPQYITIAALSYFQHLKDTKPELVQGFTIRSLLLDEKKYTDETGNKITTWIPFKIKTEISNSPLQIEHVNLLSIGLNYKIKYDSINTVCSLMTQEYTKLNDRSPILKNIKDFWVNLSLIIKASKFPANRVWSE